MSNVQILARKLGLAVPTAAPVAQAAPPVAQAAPPVAQAAAPDGPAAAPRDPAPTQTDINSMSLPQLADHLDCLLRDMQARPSNFTVQQDRLCIEASRLAALHSPSRGALDVSTLGHTGTQIAVNLANHVLGLPFE